MIPGKQYAPEDLLAILRKRYWLLIVPAALLAAAVALIARQLPNRYLSEATVLVVPQQVAQNLVRTTVQTNLATRLQSISQQILSRTRLERIIQDLNLHPAERQTGLMEDVVTRVRADIKVAVVRGDAFKVSYEGSDPKTVQQVAASVASLFIEESLRDRALLAEGTDQFLEVQLDDARRRLIEQEKTLEQYRVKYSGQLPTQLGGNLQVLQSVQMQVQATLESINRDRDQRLLYQRQLADLEDGSVSESAGPAPAPSATITTLEEIGKGPVVQQLADAKALLASLELRYKPDYPDIPRTKRLIQELERKLDAEVLGRPVSSAGIEAAALSPQEQARLKRAADLRAQIEQIDRKIATSQANETRLRANAADYQKKVEAIPARESELTELTRDYATLQDTYTSLLRRKEESNIAANLERRQIGEQFKLLDPAQLPERPVSPNRPMLTAIGMFLGVVLGLGIIVLIEFKDTSFATDDEIARLLALPVLAVVPAMQSDVDQRREARQRWITVLGLGSTVAGCIAVIVYSFVR